MNAPAVCGTATALPPHRYAQRELADVARQVLSDVSARPAAIERFFTRVGVEARHLALPAEAYTRLSGFQARNDAWLDAALPLGVEAITGALSDANLEAGDVDVLFTTTVTGIAVPSIDARLMNRLPLRRDLKRVPMFGLGCLGGATGIARAADYLRAFPDHVAVLLAVELCSLTVQADDGSVANIISSGLFGDGAAAVVLVGASHAAATRAATRPRVLDSLSHFFPQTERLMGWDVVDGGFKIVLSPDVPTLAREGVPALVDRLLDRHGLTRGDITSWLAHPGGPAVMTALIDGLGLPPDALAPTRRSLANVGNMSSASVLFLLDDFRTHLQPATGGLGVMLAMGPAFSAEAVLLQW